MSDIDEVDSADDILVVVVSDGEAICSARTFATLFEPATMNLFLFFRKETSQPNGRLGGMGYGWDCGVGFPAKLKGRSTKQV